MVIEMTETTAVIETIETMTVIAVTRTGIITARTADAQEEMVRDSLVREEMTEVLQHLRTISFLRQSQIQEDQTQERMIQERMTERKIMRQRKILSFYKVLSVNSELKHFLDNCNYFLSTSCLPSMRISII